MLCYFTCKFFQLIYNIKFSFAHLLDIFVVILSFPRYYNFKKFK